MKRESDREWLTRIFEAHHAQVRAYAIRRCGALHDAEDVTSEVFVLAWRRRSDVTEPELPWLLGVARLKCQESARSRFRRDRLNQRLIDVTDSAAADHAQTHADRQLSGQMLAALAALSETDRELLLLLEWDQLAPVDIATMLGISSGALRVRAHRVRQRLSEHYHRHAGSRSLTHFFALDGIS